MTRYIMDIICAALISSVLIAIIRAVKRFAGRLLEKWSERCYRPGKEDEEGKENAENNL